jgi:hypothetical protein
MDWSNFEQRELKYRKVTLNASSRSYAGLVFLTHFTSDVQFEV